MNADSSNRLAILCAICATAAFSLNDAIVKILSSNLPLHQIVFFRTLIALVIIMMVLVPFEGGISTLKTRRPLLHLIRGVAIVIANISFFSGLVVLPIANATAIFFVAPLMITSFSVVFLNEYVYIRRWLALAMGLGGVWMIVQPGSANFQWAYLLPIIAALGYAILNTITRGMGLRESAGAMAFYVQITFLVTSGTASIFLAGGEFAGNRHPSAEFLLRGWVVPGFGDAAMLLVSGTCTAVAGYLISQAYRHGEAGLVTPFEYTALVLSLVWGYLFWQELPAATAAIGIAMILGSGLFIAIVETRRRSPGEYRLRKMR